MKKVLIIIFILGISLIGITFWNSNQYRFINRPYLGLPTPTPTPLPTALPADTLLPVPFTQNSWKTYVSPLGVSFAYPPNFELASQITPTQPYQGPYASTPTIMEVPEQNLVDITYGYSYIFRITKITSQESIMSIAKNDWTVSYMTTLSGFPAILSIETQEFVKNAQVPENIYYVKSPTQPNIIYKIEYAIPMKVQNYPSSFTAEEISRDEESLRQQNEFFLKYIPQILGSIKFL